MSTPKVNKTSKGGPSKGGGASMSSSNPNPHNNKLKTSMANSYDWLNILSRDNNAPNAVSVSSFKYAPLSEVWDDLVTCGLKVEVRNTDTEPISPDGLSNGGGVTEGYWIASVVKFAGYYVLLRYEGFANDSSKDFWVNIFTNAIHPVGWCASQGKVLIPPKTVESKFTDWKEFLVKRLTGSRTLPENFNEQLRESLRSRFNVGMRLEVVDKKRISAVRVAYVDQIIGGRLHIIYEGEEDTDTGFWCHQFSPLIHPVGWAQLVGHELRATKEYAEESLMKAMNRSFDPMDAEWTLFPPVKTTLGISSGPSSSGQIMHGSHPSANVNPRVVPKFEEGMKLEAIDPLNLSTICVATVTKVLRSNYLMIGIDGMMAADGSDWFCYHATSPCIFPVGFCKFNNIELTPPRNYVGEFDWMRYLSETNSRAAPVALFKKDIPKHGFKEGYHLEAVDLMEPRLICVATVTKVVGRLLRVHFNGWDESYDQWCDCESPELFPAGWCQLVGYPLEPPKGEGDSFSVNANDVKRKKGSYKGKRKKKLNGGRGGHHNNSLLNESIGLAHSESLNDGSIDDEEDDDENDESIHNSHETSNNLIMHNGLQGFNSQPHRTQLPSTPQSLTANVPPTIRPVGRVTNQHSPSSLTINQSPASSSSNRNNSSQLTNSSVKVIPSPPEPVINLDMKSPSKWSVREVTYYLKSNNAGGYSNSFAEQVIHLSYY